MRKLTRIHLDSFIERHASKERTLDIGAGGNMYKKYFPNRTTLDVSSEGNPDVIGDAHALPFQDHSFPRILCTEVLEHLIEPSKAIAEMKRVLTPGGTLILTTRFVYPVHSTQDYWRFTHYGLKKLFEDWNILEFETETTDFGTLGALLQRLGFQTDLKGGKVSKAFVYALSALTGVANILIKKRYSDIQRRHPETHIMASGYYLVAQPK